MAENDWKKRLGVVYSTNPDFAYTEAETAETQTLEAARQRLVVTIDRSGKGFVWTQEDLAALSKTLKTRCGVGGTAKDGEITVQGDWRDKVTALLREMGYNAKRGN